MESNRGYRTESPASRGGGGAAMANNTNVVPPPSREEFGSDTWTNYLAAERDRRLKRGAGGNSNNNNSSAIKSDEKADMAKGDSESSGRPLTVPEMIQTLEAVIDAQNGYYGATMEAVKTLRRNEERQRCAAASYHPQASLVENTPCMVVLHSLLTSARTKWKALLMERVPKFISLKPNLPLPRIPSVALPTYTELFDVLVEGLNAQDTLHRIEEEVLCGGVPSSGLEAFGLHSVFKAQVRALSQFDTLSPSAQSLRAYFADLAPQSLSSTNGASHMETNIESYEEQLDTFFRHGDQPDQLSAVLRSGIHPSLRRLYYARALQLPLVVTDGRPLFGEQGDFMTNHFPRGFLPAYLTFATKKTRERIKRRHTHSSSGTHSAMVLQPLMKHDTQSFVGDSEKYFVYTDDVEVLSSTLMVDAGVSEAKLKDALSQMGRPEMALNAYRLDNSEQSSSGGTSGSSQKKPSVVLHAILPASATLLMAPLCNVTGDTVEQYELVSAMFSQIWKRLLGPTPELTQCCWIFERLTEEHALPAVAKAMRVLQHPPLLLALQWMLTGFSEVLAPSEVLSFWDILLAYHIKEMTHRSPLSGLVAGETPADRDSLSSGGNGGSPPLVPCSLWLLAVMAAAVFVFRAPLVERAETREQLLQVFAVSHHLMVRPLLQQLLFSSA